jgi:chemosensory pili system protein ChpC
MSERDDEIYCLLVPLVDQRLVIPRSCVAEVIGYVTPADTADAPPWYLGIVNWNGRYVPLLSFEGCCGGKVPPPSSRARIVILHAVSPQVESGYFAVLSQGYPQLVRVARKSLRPADTPQDAGEDSPSLCRIRLLDESPVVPDLAGLETMLGTVLAAPPQE